MKSQKDYYSRILSSMGKVIDLLLFPNMFSIWTVTVQFLFHVMFGILMLHLDVSLTDHVSLPSLLKKGTFYNSNVYKIVADYICIPKSNTTTIFKN